MSRDGRTGVLPAQVLKQELCTMSASLDTAEVPEANA